jgi:hypothetical protein
MEVSPRSRLYRRLSVIVTCVAALLTAGQIASAQFARKNKPSKGPRALGLLEIAPSGKAHLVPIAILYQGQFYDATAYKADPVPMALDSQTVYEAERTGASEGLFTVTDARQLKNTWIGDGTFVPKGTEVAKKAVPEFKPPADEDDSDKPPVLRRPGSESSKPPATPPAAPTKPTAAPAPPVAPVATAPSKEPEAAAPPPRDPDRPVLRRGPQPEKGSESYEVPKSKSAAAKPASSATKSGGMQIMPAISDAAGPEPQSYAYDAKPDEEQKFQKKMLAMASEAVLAHKKELIAEEIGPKRSTPLSRKPTKAAKPPQPQFQNVRLRIMDLSSSNEPVLVLTATATLPPADKDTAGLQYYVALVARDDIYDELHKVLANVTDDHHLDVTPKMEFIDAVDADGDGRGELLFRKTSDGGRAFVIYRVVGDQLYPLFEGTPS